MAAVAGALNDLAFKRMIEIGVTFALIENGGEVMAKADIPIYIGIFAGPSPISGKIAFEVDKFPIGIASSSASVGGAFTFGSADAAIIFAENSSLADAAATGACNLVQGENYAESIKKGLEYADNISGIKGAMIARGEYVGSIGRIPNLVSIREEVSVAKILKRLNS
jgi:ApbE superfamily uncharacterized protein (UPF0280 family)